MTIDIISESEEQEGNYVDSVIDTATVMLNGLESMGAVSDWRIERPEEW